MDDRIVPPVVIDGVLKEWGERLFYEPLKPRKGPRLRRGGGGGAPSRPRAARTGRGALTPRGRLRLTVTRAPEVMVKISGGGRNRGAVEAHLGYIGRHGKVEVEDQDGQVYLGKDDLLDLREAWADEGHRIPESGDGPREAFNIVLSMPPGTDREAVKAAARAFAGEMFDRHQWVLASHEDEAHPHAHLSVKAVSLDGVRLNPRKADLREWREVFAEHLRERGVAANATPRRARGITQKRPRQETLHMLRRGEKPRVWAERGRAVADEVKGRGAHENPAAGTIAERRREVENGYGAMMGVLSRSEFAPDRELADRVLAFLREMPPVRTRHQEAVEEVRAQLARQRDRGPEPSRGVGIEPGRREVGPEPER